MNARAGLIIAVTLSAACTLVLGDDFEVVDQVASTSATTAPASTSAATGGSAGAGGTMASCANAFPGNGDACNTCMEENCCAQMSACVASPSCYECVTTRSDRACAGLDQAFFDFNQCWAAHCSSPIPVCAAKPACDAPPMPPSGGACFQMTANDDCNPLTNAGCMPTEYCTFSSAGSYCRTQNQNQAVCEVCDNTVPLECGPGLQCTFANECGRWCCDDGDCGSGTCIYQQLVDIHPELGTCYQEGSFYF
jgi:hypothetical protein